MSDAAATLELPVGIAGPNGLATIALPDVGCPKCGNLESWGCSSWCPNCGYYPRLGTSITEPEAVAVVATESCFAPSSTLDVWRYAPVWMKVLIVGVLGIFGGSIAVRVLTPDKSIIRSLIGTCELLVGLGL